MRSPCKHMDEMVLYSVLLKVVKGLHYCCIDVFCKLDTKGRSAMTRQQYELKVDLCMNSGVYCSSNILLKRTLLASHNA